MIRITQDKHGQLRLYVNGKLEMWPQKGQAIVFTPQTVYQHRTEKHEEEQR
jgi:hypothetical protein